tara:strand:- start:141 stop:416 length:276 start_codon:yes stop_codon:yes gene_type:complete
MTLSNGHPEELPFPRPVLKLFFAQMEKGRDPVAGVNDTVSTLTNKTTRKEKHQCWGTTVQTADLDRINGCVKLHLAVSVDKTNMGAEVISY